MNPTLLILSLSLFLVIGSDLIAEEKPPNVVLIFADDLGYGDLACYGASKLKTPHIDKLAAEGRKFTDAHSASAVCTPSRYGLLTGEYPFRANNGKGLWGPAPITSPLLIDTETLTIADIFKTSGYDTAAFGKWHLGFGTGKNDWQEPLRPGPQDLGFDYYFGMPVVNSAPPYVYVENDRVVGGDPTDPLVHLGRNARETTPITPIPPEAAQRSANQFKGAVEAHKLFNDYEVGTKLTEKATSWIKSRGENPFFLYFSTTNIHHPFTPAKQFQGTSECGVYGDFVHELDWIVGEVMKSLHAAGVADNTLVIFTSDNGGMFNHGGRAAAAKGHKINGDLLGSKFGIWEGGHRVPFIAWWPEKIEAGSSSDQLLCSVDMLSSVAALTGHKLANHKDSINMLPALTGNPEKPLRTELFMSPNKPSHMAYRKGKWMYIPAKSDGGFRGSKPNQHAWGGAAVTKLVNTPNSDIENGKLKKNAAPAQLYDLEADVNQTKNLYHEHPKLVKKMAATLKKAQLEASTTPEETNKKKAASSTAKKSLRAATTKPNFIVIFADDLGYGDISCYDQNATNTPHLDTLAREGFRSTDFFVPANVCSPSRAALLTGRYPMRCGMPVARYEKADSKYKDYGFSSDEITIPELLKPAGYRSLMVGKWHLGMEVEGSHPIDAGFDEHLGIPSNYGKNRGPNHNTLYRGKKVEQRNTPFETLTERYTDEVVAFIRKQKDDPFFIYVSHHIVHTPLLPRKEFIGSSKKGKYGDFIKELDHSTGRIMKALHDSGLDDNTLVVFTSDNGPLARFGSSGGLNGGKYCTMEGGHRVPGIFRWPGQISPKQVSDITLTSMDLLPLFCKLADVEEPNGRKIDGKNILPVLLGKENETPHNLLYYYNGTNLQAIREGKWKLHLPRTSSDQPFWCKKKGPGRVFVTLEQPTLFDLNNDLAEKNNVAKNHPEVVARLQKHAEIIRAELGDVRITGSDQRSINLEDPQER